MPDSASTWLNNLYMNKRNGFTLIELVTTIVIMGTLAITMAPKFISFSSDAKAATLKAVAANIQSAANLAYSKALIQNKNNLTSSELNIAGQKIKLAKGYPVAFFNGPMESGILGVIALTNISGYGSMRDNSQNEFVYQLYNKSISVDKKWVTVPTLDITFGSLAGNGTNGNAKTPENTHCYFTYWQATDKTTMRVTLDTSGC